MALKGAMHVTGRGFAVAFLLTCAAISLMALRKTSNSTAAMQLEAGFSDAHPLGLSRRYTTLEGDLMDEGRGADRQTSREVELLRKRVKTLMKEKSQALVKVELLSSLYAKNVSALQSTLQDKLHQRDTTIDALRQQLKTQQDKVKALEAASKAKPPAKVHVTQAAQSSSSPVPLPAWSTGSRFYVLGSVLTRDMYEDRLFVDVMVMGRKIFDGTLGDATGVKGLDDRWEEGKRTNVLNPRDLVRKHGAAFACTIPGVGEVAGELIPTDTTLDPNVNDVVEMVRCPVPDSYNRDIDVTLLLREPDLRTPKDSPPKETTLIRFTLPWTQRTTGYLSYRPESSKLDPWSGEMDDLHLCVPGLRSTFECPLVDLVIEFLEYHVGHKGVAHVHLGVDYKWGSEDMDTLLKVVRSYIDDGKVSVSSYDVMDGADEVGSEMKKLYHLNHCVAYSKGLARYVGIWDTDELMVPRQEPSLSLPQLIDGAVERSQHSYENSCFLLFKSYSHQSPKTELPREQLWLGQQFKATRETQADDTWQKSIINNRNVYYVGYHLPGACRAEGRKWTDTVNFDDAIIVSPEEAAMYHYRNKLSSSAPWFKTPDTTDSEYATQFFPQVLEGIAKRGLDKVVAEVCGITPQMTVV